MFKKYFAMTIIAASVALAACSDDDDDDGNGDNGGTVVDPAPENVDTGTAYDIIAGSPDHETLEALINSAGLQSALDGPAADGSDLTSVLTVFAPDDDAFTEYDDAVQLTLDDDDPDNDGTLSSAFTNDQLTRILLNHVVAGSFQTLEDGAVLSTLAGAVDADDTTTPPSPALVAQTLTASIAETGETSIAAINGDPVPVEGEALVGTEEGAVEQDVVHVIGSILVPSDLPPTPEVVVTPDPDPDTGNGGTGTDGTVLAELQNDPDGFTAVLAALSGNEIKLDEESGDPWTIVAPTDAALAGASVQLNDIVSTQGGFTVDDLIDAGTITMNGGTVFAVGGTSAEDLTIGGAPATFVGGGSSKTYKLTGVPVAN